MSSFTLNDPTVYSKFFKITFKCYLQQAMLVKWHFLDGTQRFEEPVSKITLNDWGGVPMLITP